MLKMSFLTIKNVFKKKQNAKSKISLPKLYLNVLEDNITTFFVHLKSVRHRLYYFNVYANINCIFILIIVISYHHCCF